MSITEKISSAEPVQAARAALAGDAGNWIVGGALRNALRDEPIVDLDLAVSGDPSLAARAIGKAGGAHAFELSGEFATWRVVRKGEWQVDVASLRGGSIEADLDARDFTINAMALPLAEQPDGEVLDPHGGSADLQSGLLRAVSERSFADDAIRLLRAVRFAADLSLEVDPATRELALSGASAAGDPAGERQLAELRVIVGSGDPLRGVALMDELGITGSVLPELEQLRGVAQNPNHHLDVLGHTLEVLAHELEIERDLEAYVGTENAAAVAELFETPLADGLTHRDGLRFAALFHDLGKPATRDIHGGYVTFIGHDHVGATIIRDLCARLRTSRRLSDYLAGIAQHHLRLGFLVAQRPLPRRIVHDYLRVADPDAVDLTLLTMADRLSARGSGATASEEMITGHLELAREMVGDGLAWTRDGPPRAPIPGDELAAELGIEPGPELGRLISELEAAVFAGEISDRDGAVEMARSLLETSPGS